MEAEWLANIYDYVSYSPMPPEMFFLKEFQLAADLGFIRFGLTLGSSNYSYLSHWKFEDYWGDWEEDRDYDLSMVPMIYISLSTYPLRLSNSNLPFRFFLGGCIGFVTEDLHEGDEPGTWPG